MIVGANVFSKLEAMKDLVKLLSRKSCFRTPFDRQHVICGISMRAFFFIFPITLRETDLEKFSLSDMWNLRVFVNTLTADGKYPLPNFENLPLSIQMQLSKIRKAIYDFFVSFVEFASNLKNKKIVIANIFPILQTMKDLVRPLSGKHRFRTPSESEHVKGSKTLVKSAGEHFYHIF